MSNRSSVASDGVTVERLKRAIRSPAVASGSLAVYALREVAARLHKTARWLREWLRDNPRDRSAGRGRGN